MTSDVNSVIFERCHPLAEDAHQVMSWRNDPVTLAASFHQQPKKWPEFLEEFQTDYFVEAPGLWPVFAIAQGVRVGFIRFKRVAHPLRLSGTTVELSINLSPDHRGKGLGLQIMADCIRFLAEQGVESVYAEVLANNDVSLKFFRTAGFSDLGPSTREVADPQQVFAIHRFLTDLSGSHWRTGRVFIIAEAGSNWRMGSPTRDMAMARALVDVAVNAGADAVKFQTYRPDTVYVANAGTSDYLSEAGNKQNILDIFADQAMPYEMIPDIRAYCDDRNIAFMTTPFSPQDFEVIDPYVAIHKIASYEISHPHLIRLAAESGKPTLMSTGASSEADIVWAVDHFRRYGGSDLCLLQCTAKYPTPVNSLNLNVIPWLQRRFGVSAGLSDHSRDAIVPAVVAVALGARAIEKHFTLHNKLPGADHAFALTPDELSHLVQAVRSAEDSLGNGIKVVQDVEQELALFARRGVQATRDIIKGELLIEGDNMSVLRPGKQRLGSHPKFLDMIKGRRARGNIAMGVGITLEDVEPLASAQ